MRRKSINGKNANKREGELLKDKNSSRINDPELSQSICTAVQVALVDLLRSLGVIPAAVIGHSSGEIAAAYAPNSTAWFH